MIEIIFIIIFVLAMFGIFNDLRALGSKLEKILDELEDINKKIQ